MLISDSVLFPRNLAFFQRLPARFEILVLARGEKTANGTFYELQVAGQKLTLLSKVDLKNGSRYELEKTGDLTFKIVRENFLESEKNVELLKQIPNEAKSPHEINPLLHWHSELPARLLLKILEASDGSIKAAGEKVIFDFEAEFRLKGLFLIDADRKISLFLTGRDDLQQIIDDLRTILHLPNLKQIAVVREESFAALAAGGVNWIS